MFFTEQSVIELCIIGCTYGITVCASVAFISLAIKIVWGLISNIFLHRNS